MDFFVEQKLLSEKWFQKFGQDFSSHGVKPAKQDCLVVDYLLQSYNHLNGVILNVERDFNIPLQFLTFLRNTCDNTSVGCLIVCPDEALVKWHYWASRDEKFSVILVTEEEIQNQFKTPKLCICLLNFSRLKLLESIVEYDFSTLVIDSLDMVATKLIIRKSRRNFNIGITYRNFYEKPDQKLQWTMLDWANRGCVGKWSNFPLLDNDNFGLFRDSYRQWWLRLTWNFCNSFVKPTLEEKNKWNDVLKKWASLPIFKSILVTENTGRKGTARKRKLAQRQRKEKSPPLVNPQRMDSSDSEDTVIYELANKTVSDENFISQCHTDKHETTPPVKTEVVHTEDESDVFLKYVATNKNFSKVFVKSKNFLQNNHSLSDQEVDSELMERRLFKTGEFTESDSFLKEICSQSPIKAEIVSEREIYTLETSLEVDALVADVMKMVQQ